MKNLKLLFLLAMSLGYTVQANQLHDAVEANDIVKIKKLIKKGMDVNSLDEDGFTPLFRCKTKEAAQCLVDQGANVNCACNDNDGSVVGWTPLHEALDNPEISSSYVLYLLESGAHVHTKSTCHGELYTPLSMFFEGFYDMVKDAMNLRVDVTFPTLDNTVVISDNMTPQDFFYSLMQKRALLEARSEKSMYFVEAELLEGFMFDL